MNDKLIENYINKNHKLSYTLYVYKHTLTGSSTKSSEHTGLILCLLGTSESTESSRLLL